MSKLVVTRNEQSSSSELESAIARIKKEYYLRHFDIAVEQMTHASKWLTASLFAMNGAGILTVVNSVKHLNDPIYSAIPFIVGLTLAMISATLLQEIYNRVSEPIGELAKYWHTIEAGLKPNPTQAAELENQLKRMSRWFWTAPVAGWASGLAFFGGIVHFCLSLNLDQSTP